MILDDDKKIVGLLLIPLQLLVLYFLGNFVLLFTDSPVIIELSNLLTNVPIFFIAISLFKDVLKNDWGKLSIPKWKFLLYTVLGVFILQFVAIYCQVMFNAPLLADERFSKIIQFSDLTLLNRILFIIFSTSALFTAVTEEIYFRYLFLNPESRLNRFMALLISSGLFGLSHYIVHFDLASCIPYFGVGLFLGIVYLKSKNLWSVIAIHVLNNLLFGVFGFLF